MNLALLVGLVEPAEVLGRVEVLSLMHESRAYICFEGVTMELG
jgi:hypothetical protein